MFVNGETNKLFVFALIASGAVLSFYAAYKIAIMQLGLAG